MPPKKETALQVLIESQEAWDTFLTEPCLYVVDAYHDWAGPCPAMISHLKKIKHAVNDDILQFACANIDKVDTLELFRGWCEPNFLIYGSGVLIGQVRGCNAPALELLIRALVEVERAAQTAGGERIEIVPNIIGTEGGEVDLDAEKTNDDNDDVSSALSSIFDELEIELTIGLIKPDILEKTKQTAIIKKIKAGGIKVVERKEMLLTEDDVITLYDDHVGKAYFEDLTEYMTSAPCQVLLLTRGETGEGVVELFRKMIGPFDAAVAKEQYANSLRAKYGTCAAVNALHGSSDRKAARREVEFFYPEYKIPSYIKINKERYTASKYRKTKEGRKLQRTLAIIRPDALRKFKDDILWTITKELGLNIAIQKEMELTRAQVQAFYEDQKAEPYYPILTKQMTYGPILALCLTHEEDAVDKWKTALGPKTVEELKNKPECLRSQFHVSGVKVNLLHGSETKEDAENELGAFFQMDQTLAIIKPEGYDFGELIIPKFQEIGFVVSAQKTVQLTMDMIIEIYRNQVEQDFFEDLAANMLSGPSLAVVLSAENAVKKLRKWLGSVDPRRARRKQPKSLRAHFGYNILANSVHAVSNDTDARQMIKKLFPDTRFDWDGYCTENPNKEFRDPSELIPRLRKLAPALDSESEDDEDSDGDPDFVDPGPFALLPPAPGPPTAEELAAIAAAKEAAAAEKGKRKKRKGKKGKGKKDKGKKDKGKKDKGKKDEGKKCKGKKGGKKRSKKAGAIELEDTGVTVKKSKKGALPVSHEDFGDRTTRAWSNIKLSRSQQWVSESEVEESKEEDVGSKAKGKRGGKGKAVHKKSPKGTPSRRASTIELIECVNSDNPLSRKCSSVRDCAEVARQRSAAEIIECVNSDNPLTKKCSSVRDCAEVARKASASGIIECVNSDNPLSRKCSSVRDCNSIAKSGGCAGSTCSAANDCSSAQRMECANSTTENVKTCQSAADCREVEYCTSKEKVDTEKK